MDYVYVCREGQNEELRYSIRSIVKNAPEGRVWLVGGKPDWYTGDFIPVKDTKTKFDNIKLCIKAAADNEDISEDFVLMNDDFFIIDKIDKISTVHGGSLLKRINDYKRHIGANGYIMLLSRTYSALTKVGIDDPLDYDIHTPMVLTKSKLGDIVDTPYSIRSWYGNLQDAGGSEINDVKMYASGQYAYRSYSIDPNNPYLSTEDSSFSKVKDLLVAMFPDKSKYEV